MNIWIPGGKGAIGDACVQKLLLAGHHVFIGHADIRNADEIASDLGERKIAALVYSVGINYLDWSRNISWHDMLDVYNTNVVGLIRCLALAPEIKKCVVIGSDAATRPMRTSVAYNASKAALNAAVRCIARERAKDLQINVVAPGLVDSSDMTEYVFHRTKRLRPELDLAEYMLAGIPAGRAGKPSEIAECVRWLIEDAPGYLNGSIIEVNGGR